MKTVWGILGVAPTRDRSAVRRAYAEKLKQTNPEDDPEGFQELRSAYELVLAQLSRPEMAEAVAADVERLEQGGDVARPAGPPAVVVGEPAAEMEPSPPDLVARHWQACRDMQQWIAETHPPAEEADRVLGQILASPAMENLSVRAETERGLAHTILGLAPHADGLIGRCIAFFGWNASAQDWGGLPEASAVVQRVDTLRVAGELKRRAHAHHKAYEIMTRPPPKGGALALLAMARHRGDVREFFVFARRYAPGIFGEFPRETVDFWARHGGNSKPLLRLGGPVIALRRVFSGLFLIFLIVRVVIFFAAVGANTYGTGNAPRAPPSSMEMRTQSLAIIDGRALEELKAGEVSKARDDYDFALRQYPGDPEALFGQGLLRTRAGDDSGNADKLAAIQADPWVRNKFVDPAIPASDLMVFDTAPTLAHQPTRAPRLPAGLVLDAPLTLSVRCLVGKDGSLHDCASTVPLPVSQEALGEAAIRYIRSAKASPGQFRATPVDNAPILLSVTLGPGKPPPGAKTRSGDGQG